MTEETIFLATGHSIVRVTFGGETNFIVGKCVDSAFGPIYPIQYTYPDADEGNQNSSNTISLIDNVEMVCTHLYWSINVFDMKMYLVDFSVRIMMYMYIYEPDVISMFGFGFDIHKSPYSSSILPCYKNKTHFHVTHLNHTDTILNRWHLRIFVSFLLVIRLAMDL